LPFHPQTPALPRVEKKRRNGPALHASPLEDEEVLSLNLAAGCAHQCGFCLARAYSNYPGDDVIHLFTDTTERLAHELARRTRQPRAVYVSPATDPFPPLLDVQEEACRVVEVL